MSFPHDQIKFRKIQTEKHNLVNIVYNSSNLIWWTEMWMSSHHWITLTTSCLVWCYDMTWSVRSSNSSYCYDIVCVSKDNLSHIMRKPVYALCEQQRRRSASFVIRCLKSLIPLVSISEISSLYIASVAVQAGLSLPWWQTPEDRFSRDEAHFKVGLDLIGLG